MSIYSKCLLILFTFGISESLFAQTLISPVDDAQFQNPRGVVLAWDSLPGSYKYYVRMGTDSNALSIIDSTSDTHTITKSLSLNQQYYWNVIAVNGDGDSVSFHQRQFRTGDYIVVRSRRQVPSMSDTTYDDEGDWRYVYFNDTLKLNETGIVVVDVWNTPSDSSVLNIQKFLDIAHKYSLPIFYFDHDGVPGTWAMPKPWDFRAGPYTNPADEFANRGIKNLLYVGYDASECVLFSRPISMASLTIGNADNYRNQFHIVGVRDCIGSWEQLAYDFGLHQIEANFQSTTLNDVASSFGEQSKSDSIYRPSYYPELQLEAFNARTDTLFGKAISKDSTALVIINGWDTFANDGFYKKIKENNRQHLQPLLRWARANGITVAHILNGQQADSVCAPEGAEPVFDDKYALHSWLFDKGIRYIMFAGNLTSFSKSFSTFDVAAMSNSPWYWSHVGSPFSTRLLMDCITVFEVPETRNEEKFKAEFLERATVFGDGEKHKLALFNTLQKNVDRAPFFSIKTDTIYCTDGYFSYNVVSADSDSTVLSDSVTLSLPSAPQWARIDSNSSNLSGILPPDMAEQLIPIRATDRFGGQAERSLLLRYNHRPRFVTTPDTIAYSNAKYTYKVGAQDSDHAVFGDTIIYRLLSAPSWLSMDSITNELSGTPQDFSTDTVVTIAVSDRFGTETKQVFSIHIDHIPNIVSVPVTMAVEDSGYYYQLLSTDADTLWGDKLRYRLISENGWLGIDSVTGILHGIPGISNLRDTVVIVQVYDHWGGMNMQSFTLSMRHVNHPPVIISSPDTTATEKELYSYYPVAKDIDSVLGDSIRFRFLVHPDWLSIDSLTGHIFGEPKLEDVGDTIVVLAAKDLQGAEIKQKFSLHIFRAYFPPSSVATADPPEEGVVVLQAKELNFAWHPSVSFTDSVWYSLHVKGNGLDTIIRNIRDTVYTLPERVLKDEEYKWWVVVRDGYTRVVPPSKSSFYLMQTGRAIVECFPNPIKTSSTVRFRVWERSQVNITVKNPVGQSVITLARGNYEPGIYSFNWSPSAYPEGLYFLQVSLKGEQSKKIQTTTMKLLYIR